MILDIAQVLIPFIIGYLLRYAHELVNNKTNGG